MAYRRFGKPRRFGPRQMFPAICADCGAECEVPLQASRRKARLLPRLLAKTGISKRPVNS